MRASDCGSVGRQHEVGQNRLVGHVPQKDLANNVMDQNESAGAVEKSFWSITRMTRNVSKLEKIVYGGILVRSGFCRFGGQEFFNGPAY